MKFFTLEGRDVYYKNNTHVGGIDNYNDLEANILVIQICDFMLETIYDRVEEAHDITYDNENHLFTIRDEYNSIVIPVFIDLNLYYEMVGIRLGSHTSNMNQHASVEMDAGINEFEHLLELSDKEFITPEIPVEGVVHDRSVTFTNQNYKELVLDMMGGIL